MSNDYYNNDTYTLATGEIARATDVEGKCDAIVTGFDKLPTEAHLKRETTNFVNASGTANTYTVTLNYTPTAYVDGMCVLMRVNVANTGASTINVDSLGTKAIKRIDGTDLLAGDLAAGKIVELRYDSSNDYFVLMQSVSLMTTDADTVDGEHATAFAYRANNLSDLANASTALTNLGGLAAANNLSDVDDTATALSNLGGTPKTTFEEEHNSSGEHTTINLTGGQIAFPSTQNASSDANTLDDYEEGSWTPALEGSTTAGDTTYTTQIGRYEKIGRLVIARGEIEVGTKGTTIAGTIRITGLPFIVGTYTPCSLHFGWVAGVSINAGESLTGFAGHANVSVNIVIWNTVSGTLGFTEANLTDSTHLRFVLIYGTN